MIINLCSSCFKQTLINKNALTGQTEQSLIIYELIIHLYKADRSNILIASKNPNLGTTTVFEVLLVKCLNDSYMYHTPRSSFA